MRLLTRHDGNEYWSDRVADAATLRSPVDGEPYVCLLWAGQIASIDEKAAAAEALLASNCGYVVCGGIDCEQWHDVVDEVAVMRERFVMTTWHEDEPIDEVAWFFTHAATQAEDQLFTKFLAVVVDRDAASETAVRAAVRRAIESDPMV